MIWDIIEQSSFSTHFTNPNLTLQQLLVDQNILTQMKNLNPQLLQYINQNIDSIVNKLIQYVTVMPKVQDGYDRCYKLPYVSSEMLAIESQIFYQVFFGKQGEEGKVGVETKKGKDSTKYLDRLFQFLKTDAVNNELLLGYFQKVVNNLQKGRRLDLSKYISNNLPTFTTCLHLPTIGTLLTSSIILQNHKQGILEVRTHLSQSQRKQITSQLIHSLIKPYNPSKSCQIRQICGNALIEILGKHKTFSSGDQIVNYMFNYCGELLVLYSFVDVGQVVRVICGIMKASLMKIYNPEIDVKENIFRLPHMHRTLLVGYMPLRLHQILTNPSNLTNNKIRQQNGAYITRIHPQVLDYLTLISLTLQNQIDQFLLDEPQSLSPPSPSPSSPSPSRDQTFNSYLNFIWQTLRNHPKNDIALVQIVKIFSYICGDACEKSKNKNKLRTLLCKQWDIVGKFVEVWKNQEEQRMLRPHLFQVWSLMRGWVGDLYEGDMGQQWGFMCKKYEELVPLYKKAVGLNYNRPTAIKLVVDQQQLTQNKQPTLSQVSVPVQSKVSWRSPPQKQPQQKQNTKQQQAPNTQTQPMQQSESPSQQHQLKNQFFSSDLTIKQKKQYEITQEMAAWMDGSTDKDKTDAGFKKQQGKMSKGKVDGFQAFDQFFTDDSKKIGKDEKKVDDFSAFDAFM